MRVSCLKRMSKQIVSEIHEYLEIKIYLERVLDRDFDRDDDAFLLDFVFPVEERFMVLRFVVLFVVVDFLVVLFVLRFEVVALRFGAALRLDAALRFGAALRLDAALRFGAALRLDAALRFGAALRLVVVALRLVVVALRFVRRVVLLFDIVRFAFAIFCLKTTSI